MMDELLELVDRVLLPYRECDGHNFDHGIPVDCPMEPVCNINGQDFCVKHMDQAWEPEDEQARRLR